MRRRFAFGLVLLVATLFPASVGAEPAAQPLLPGDDRTLTLAPGETHIYRVDLRAGEFLHVLFEQQEIDLVVTLIDAAGRRLELDNPYGLDVPESLALIARTAGRFRCEVRPARGAARAGAYRLLVRAWREPTDEDRLRTEAEALTYAAHQRAARRADGDLQAALEGYDAARELWRRLGDGREEARNLRRQAQLRQGLGEYDAALDVLGQAFRLEQELENSAGIAATLSRAGTVYRRLGQNARARTVYEEALAIWSQLGEVSQAARVELNLGHTLQGMGETHLALQRYQSALAAFGTTGDRLRAATALASMGPLQTLIGRPDLAADGYERALALFRQVGRRDHEADTLNNLARTLNALGEPRAALEGYSAALDIYRELGDPRRQAAALNSLGRLLRFFGMPEEARALLLEALDLLRESGDAFYKSRVLVNLGGAARELGDVAAALDAYERALFVQRRAEDRGGEGWTLLGQATVFGQTARWDLAREHAEKALESFRALGDRDGEKTALQILGQAAAALHQPERARPAFDQALLIAEELGDVTAQAETRRELARLDRELGDFQGALAQLEDALGDLESLRAKISGVTLRASYFATARQTYELTVDTLMELHRQEPAAAFDRRAFALSERAHARGLLDVLGRAEVGEQGENPELRAREQQLRRELNALAAERQQAPSDALRERLSVLTAEYRLIQGRVFGQDRDDPRASTRTAAEIAALLDGDTVLLEFLLGEPRSYLWVLDRGTFESFELPGRTEIEDLAARLHRSLSQPSSDRAEQRAALERLSHLLLAPAFEHLRKKRWAIVPDGALHYVPFAALPVPRRTGGDDVAPLMVEHEIVHLPSASVLRQRPAVPRRPASGRLAILADPVYDQDDPRLRLAPPVAALTIQQQVEGQGRWTPFGALRDSDLARLPWSGREAEAIAAEAIAAEAKDQGVLLALGLDATHELATTAELGRYRIVHFATHGVLDTEHPELSGLALSRFDGAGRERESFLRLHDIYGLDWQTELVVLSGCQTALGRTVRGEGLVGLARGFLHAGATQVLASLWSVRDQATAELMRRFYAALLGKRLPPEAALQAAQLSMWRERRWRDPYFWAPFVLIGDWQASTSPSLDGSERPSDREISPPPGT